jgi:TonB family protein
MRVLVFLIAVLLVSPGGWAQSTQQGLETELVHQSFYLLGMWKKDKLHFSADGKLTDSSDVTSPLLSSVDINKVDLKGDRLELTGHRQAVIYQDGKPQTFDFGKTIHIDIKRPDTGDYGPPLAAILTPRLADLAAAAPEIWKSFLTHGASTSASANSRATTSGSPDSASLFSPAATTRRVGGGVHAPVVLNAPEPTFSQEARGFRLMPKMDAKVLVYLQVDADGSPSHIRILKPYGLGLDEKAAGAVAQYRFKPAMEGDRPVPVEMNIDVRFQKY